MTGEMSVMDKKGDTKILWDSDNQAEVENARRSFDDLRGKGYMAFTVDKRGEKGDVIRTFDPSAEKIILTPPMRGG